jgi:hypothetical protein
LSEEEARDLFCSNTKRGRGKRGHGLNPNPHPTPETERKRRAREPALGFEIIHELTEENLRRSDQFYRPNEQHRGQKIIRFFVTFRKRTALYTF